MQTILVPDFHKSLVNQNRKLQESAEKYKLEDPKTLSEKPSLERWSAMECFEHMNILYDIYINNIKQGIEKYQGRFNPAEYFKPTLVGHYFYLSMAPNEKQKPRFKIKTFNRFKPSGKKQDSIDAFLKYHKEFYELISEIPELNLDKIKVDSSIGRIMRFKLGDAFRIVTGHNQRHFLQAQKTLKSVGE